MLALDTLPPELRSAVEAELGRLQLIIKLKDEQIRLLHLKRWGPKSEKLSPAQLALLPEEVHVAEAEVEKEAALPEKQKELPKAKAPRPNHPGRAPLPLHLERRVELVPCSPEECRCSKCGEQRPIIGYEEKEELACVPAQFFVRVIRREKRGSHCLPEQGVAVAPAPERILPKSKLSDEVIIEALAGKFQQHQPIYRQCAMLEEDHRIVLSRQTLNEGILAAGQLLIPVVRAQKAELLAGNYIQADETTLACQTGEKSGKNHKAYVWQYSQPGGMVVFDFQMKRERAGPEAFLKGFKGKVQCDGYKAYDKLGEGITYVACMAHIRRGFFEASQLNPLDPVPVEILSRFGQLYEVERQARSRALGAPERLALRQEQSQPVMKSLKERLVEVRQAFSPASKLAKACDYALNQWSRMEEYLKDGQVEIDNNWCEGAMRPIALGRKNWLHLGHESAGPKVAAILSIVETCRRLDIPLRNYLKEVLPKLGNWSNKRVSELTPSAWKAAQKA